MTPRLAILTALIGGSVATGPLGAQAQAPVPSRPSLQPIPRATFIATMDADYARLDANRDGSATLAEVEANQRRIVAAAAAQRAAAAFARIDTDRNGQISLAEYSRANAPTAKPDPAPVMRRLDANRDSKVSLVEYRTLTLTNFDRLDIDKDGVLSVAEQRAGGYGR